MINILLDWSKHWSLPYNISKCKVIHIVNAPCMGNYSIAEIHLELLDEIRDLGIQIDTNHFHTNTVARKAYHTLGLICI